MAKDGIGARLKRKEDLRHLRGRAQFVADLRIADTLEVAFVRSPIAHGRLRGVTAPAGADGRVFWAEHFPGLGAIRAVPDIPGFRASDYPPLATGKVRFVGEAVAMAVARTRAEAEDLAEQVMLDIEPLPPFADTHAARRSEGTLIHEHWPDNMFIEATLEFGDVEALRGTAEIVIEREFSMARHSGVPMEGRAALAYWDHRLDELVVYCSTQFPHQIRTGMAAILGMEERRLHIIAPDVGGGFGVKNVLNPEEVMVAALARKLDRPVRWVDDMREHLLSAIHAREHYHRITAYADGRGRILGLDAEIMVDAGAYSTWPNGPFMETGMAARNLPGPYRIENYRVRTWTVATNKSPMGPYRGVARPAACFVIERIMDEVARAVGREPFEVRMENMVRPDMMPFRNVTGLLYDGGDYPAAVKKAAELVDVAALRTRQRGGEPDGRLVGVGFASYTEQTAHGCAEWVTRGPPVIPGFESACARLLPDGTLLLLVGIQSHGQGLETTLAQVACEELGIDPANVSVRHGDSSLSPFGMGTFASRSMVMAGGATARVCRELRGKMARVAAHLMQCEVDQVMFEGGMARGPGGTAVSFADLGNVAYLRQDALPPDTDPMLEATATYEPGISSGVFCYSTHAAVVAVDTDTGAVEILDYAVVEDCGTMVNPMIVDGQITGGVAQGIGTALLEEIIYDENGQPLATNLADYLMPTATDVPAIKIAHITTPSPHTEYGMKGMGEGGAIAPPAAIANAVRDALAGVGAGGAEINQTPITPARVQAALAAARKS